MPFSGPSVSCSGTPGPDLCHPEQFILLVLHTFIWNKRDPFPKQNLRICHLDRSLTQYLRPILNPLPRHHCVVSLQGQVDHSCCTPLCWGQFWCLEVSSMRWVVIHLPLVLRPGSAPLNCTLPHSHLQMCFLYSRSALQYSLWVRLSPLTPHPLLSSQEGSSLPSLPLHPCPPSSPLSASSQLCKMSGTGSALAGQAMRTAACPPSMHCCRPRSCPSRYRDDPLPREGSHLHPCPP